MTNTMSSTQTNPFLVRPRLATALALSALLFLPACHVSGNSDISYTGSRVTAETLALVGPGETEAFVLEILGEPTVRLQRADGSLIWRWDYSMATKSRGGVFLLISSSTKTTVEHRTYVTLVDGVVTKAWQD